ncbi:sirohydrochlorin chelatase [Nonomuraea sp. NPDC050328]|uniref:sirohydrochlorin chelatase n=1 Tax=Nonomuraea sp. NPDC050328 TaxID=3364361 RepID=UPI0037B2A59E
MRPAHVSPGPLAGGPGSSPAAGPSAAPLVAVAHGSRDPRAAATVAALLDLVRLARPGLEVRAAYLDHAGPRLSEALDGLAEAVVLPLLLTEAYHSRVDLPSALAEVRARTGVRVRYGRTLGPHPLMTQIMERRLAEAGVARDAETALVLVSAGSSDARANAVIARMAREWPAGWRSVGAAYASATGPSPEEAVARARQAGAARVVCVPYLLAPGYFADKVRRTSGADVTADVLGAAPELAAVLLQRYDETTQRSQGVTPELLLQAAGR